MITFLVEDSHVSSINCNKTMHKHSKVLWQAQFYIQTGRDGEQVKRATFTTTELDTFEGSLWAQELKQSSGGVNCWKLKSLSINSKNQSSASRCFCVRHFSDTLPSRKSPHKHCPKAFIWWWQIIARKADGPFSTTGGDSDCQKSSSQDKTEIFYSYSVHVLHVV